MYHTGNMNLFDDLDEIEAAERRNERHELEHHEAMIRRLQRQDIYNLLKEEKIARRIAQGKSPQSWYSQTLRRCQGRRSRTLNVVEFNRSPRDGTEYEYVIVRRPSTPEIMYTEDDVDPVDSLWLEECGMVRVRSESRGGCHIVPKSSIQKSGKEQ